VSFANNLACICDGETSALAVACYHGVLSDGVVALLQVLQLQLCDVVLRHLGALHADGVQQGTVAEDLLVQQLRGTTTGNTVL